MPNPTSPPDPPHDPEPDWMRDPEVLADWLALGLDWPIGAVKADVHRARAALSARWRRAGLGQSPGTMAWLSTPANLIAGRHHIEPLCQLERIVAALTAFAPA